jgi:hypothetical protein
LINALYKASFNKKAELSGPGFLFSSGDGNHFTVTLRSVPTEPLVSSACLIKLPI